MVKKNKMDQHITRINEITVIHSNIYRMLEYYELTDISPPIDVPIPDQCFTVTGTDSNDIKYIIFYFHTTDVSFYKPLSNLRKYYSEHPLIKPQTRTYKLKCVTVLDEKYSSNFMGYLQPVSDTTSDFYIRHKVISNYSMIPVIPQHVSCKFSDMIVYRTEEDKIKLYDDLQLNKRNGRHIVPISIIYESDPLSIWLNLDSGNILYTDGSYRYVQ